MVTSGSLGHSHHRLDALNARANTGTKRNRLSNIGGKDNEVTQEARMDLVVITEQSRMSFLP